MKHIATHHHPFATLLGPARARAARDPRSAWAVASTAASAAVRRHFPAAPSHGGKVKPTARALDASRAAAPAKASAARWERGGTRAVPWVEGLVLVLLIAFFGGGLLAILGGF